MKIAIVGLGYVGLSTSLVMSKVGYNIIAFDIDEIKINKLKKLELPFYEPNLLKGLKENKSKITFTNNTDNFNEIKIFFLCIGTPLNKNGDLDISNLIKACNNIKNNTTKDVTICIRSTVSPYTCKKIEKILNLKRIKITVNPEFLSQGSAISDFENTNRIVIGSNDPFSENLLVQLYEKFKIRFNNDCPILVMPREDAEMVKFVANSYLATRISFINDVANLCDKMNLNIDNIIDGIKHDKRIGEKYLKYGIGYGGSCLPKDTSAFINLAKNYNYNLKIIKSTVKINDSQQKLFLKKLLKEHRKIKRKKIAILGVTYKANTDDIRDSSAIYIVKELLKRGVLLNIYDPKGIEKFKEIFSENEKNINYYYNISDCISNCDIVIIMTDWAEIINYNFSELVKDRKIEIYDFKVCLKEKLKSNKNINYKVIG